MTKSTQRALRASKPKSATRQRRNETRTSEALKAGKGETGIPVTNTYEPTDVTPEDLFKAWPRKERATLIELLIDSLDAEAGDADLEETGDDEPSLGFLDCWTGSGRSGQAGGCTGDRENDDELDEPSLAAAENHVSTPETYGWAPSGVTYSSSGNQSRWAQGAINDAEGDEHDGREPDGDEGGEAEKEDDEPSLGWTDREVAFGEYPDVNGCCDLEQECEDEGAQCDDEGDQSDTGVADTDGLLEQCAGHHHCGYGTSGFSKAAI